MDQSHDPALAAHFHQKVLVGRFDEAIAQIRQAQARDPLALILRSHEGWIYYPARQYDQAIAAYHKTLELDPDFLSALTGLDLCYEQKGMFDEAITQLRKATPPFGPSIYLANAYAIAGWRADALKILNYWNEQSRRGYVDQYLVALVYAGPGEKEQAFERLQRAYDQRSEDRFPFVEEE